jgi:predicted MFS family arabinose efflux permease
LGSSFFAGFTLTSSTAWFWIRRFNWRTASIGAIPIAVAALLSAGLSEKFLLLAIAIAVAGGAFSVLYSIGLTVLGDTRQVTRWYGLKIACEAGLGAALLLILPEAVIQRWGFGGLMVAMAIVLIVLSPLMAGLPAGGTKGGGLTMGKHESTLTPPLRIALWLGLTAAMTYLFCTTMIWTFVERFAQDAGFDAVVIGNVLSLSLFLAVCGSLTAMVLGDRRGLALPLAIAASLLLVSLALLGNMDSMVSYAIAICLFTFSFGLGIPYTVSVVSRLDINGRFVVLTVPVIGVGVTLAPAVGGMLTAAGGHTALLIAGAVSILAALSLDLMALRLGLPHVDPQAAKPVD